MGWAGLELNGAGRCRAGRGEAGQGEAGVRCVGGVGRAGWSEEAESARTWGKRWPVTCKYVAGPY